MVSERAAACIAPAEGPVRFLLDARDLGDHMEEMVLFIGVVSGVHVDEEGGVRFIVNIFNRALKVVETACFGELDLSREVLDEVLVDDAVRRSKESEDVLDKCCSGV